MTLSPRQRQVLREILRGCSEEAIAARLNIAVNTVRQHRYILYQRLGVSTQAQLWNKLAVLTPEAQQLIGDDL